MGICVGIAREAYPAVRDRANSGNFDFDEYDRKYVVCLVKVTKFFADTCKFFEIGI